MSEKSEKPEKKDEEIETSGFGNPNSGSCVKMKLQKSSECVFCANTLNREKTGKASKETPGEFDIIFRENKSTCCMFTVWKIRLFCYHDFSQNFGKISSNRSKTL